MQTRGDHEARIEQHHTQRGVVRRMAKSTVRLMGGSVLLGALALLAAAPAAAEERSGETLEERLEEAERVIRELQAEVGELKQEPPAAGAAAADPKDFRVFWKDGLRAETADKKFTTRIGGRINTDWVIGESSEDLEAAPADPTDPAAGSIGAFEDGAEMRRARLEVQGTLYHDFEYKAQFDFAGGEVAFKDVYLGMMNIPYVGNLRAGHFKEPFSLEELTSSNNITFLERGLPNVFAPSRNLGFMLHNAVLEERMTWAGGFFRNTDDFAESVFDESDYALTGRLTGLPVYQDEGRVLVHLGGSARYSRPGSRETTFRQRPEVHLSERFVNTGAIPTTGLTTAGLEAAAVLGPLSVQSEFMYQGVDTSGVADNPNFWGMYVLGSYFLTGEHRPYKTSEGAFTSVKPTKNFGITEPGPGAWELVARYSELDLTDRAFAGGKLRDVTAGLNWYLNPNIRLMANYIHADREHIGDADIFGGRLQIFF